MTTYEVAASLLERLTARGLTIATAESLTGGLVCAALTDVPGASAVVRGGVVSYATDVKASVLSVPADLLAAQGAVHPAVARAMAEGVVELLGADIGVATTGVAGPDGQDGVPPGVVYIALAGVVQAAGHYTFTGGRNAVRAASVEAALALLASKVSD